MNGNENGSTGGTGWSQDPVQIEPITITGQSSYGSLGGSSSVGSGSSGLGVVSGIKGMYDMSKEFNPFYHLYKNYKSEKDFEKALEQNQKSMQAQAEINYDLAKKEAELNDYYAKLSEERSNAEWQRRFDAENEYNEGWADRLRKLGLNPLFQMTKGQAGAMASSNPTTPTSHSASAHVGPVSALTPIRSLEAELLSAQIGHVNAQTRQLDAQTVGQTNINQSYWDKFRADIAQIVATTKNTEAQTRINEATAAFKEATLNGDIEKASYELKSAFYEMQRAGISVEQGKVELQRSINVVAMQAIEKQLMSQQIELNGQQIALNNLNYRDLYLAFEQHKALVDAETQHKIAMMGETLRAAQKANDWYAYNQVIGGIGTLGNTVAQVANAFKPFPQVISSTTTRDVVSSDGEWLGGTTQTTTNTYK